MSEPSALDYVAIHDTVQRLLTETPRVALPDFPAREREPWQRGSSK